ncbi:hypothetical protein ASG14_12350 [Pedobacter sp. Leaf194]|nr:hypothetical protein ASG14_12350 [Pedobacter sp. Leaf194]
MEDIYSNHLPKTEKISKGVVELCSFSSFDELALKLASCSKNLYIIYFVEPKPFLKSSTHGAVPVITRLLDPEIKKSKIFKGHILKFHEYIFIDSMEIHFYSYPFYTEFNFHTNKVYLEEIESIRIESLFSQLFSELASKSYLFEEMTCAIVEEIILTLKRKFISQW